MQNLMIFEGHDVEVFELNGQVLFNPKHVAECLNITDVNSSIRNFNEKQVIKIKNSDMHNLHIRKLNNAGENFLTESGVYKLVFKSHKPNAEAFTNWIVDEVIPTIRKTGGYVNNDEGVPCFRRVLVIWSRETRHPLRVGNFRYLTYWKGVGILEIPLYVTVDFFRCEMVIAHKIAPHEMVCCFRIDSPFLDSEVHKNFIYLPLEKSAQKYYSKNIDTCSDDGFRCDN